MGLCTPNPCYSSNGSSSGCNTSTNDSRNSSSSSSSSSRSCPLLLVIGRMNSVPLDVCALPSGSFYECDHPMRDDVTFVTSPLIGWAHTQNNPWIPFPLDVSILGYSLGKCLGNIILHLVNRRGEHLSSIKCRGTRPGTGIQSDFYVKIHVNYQRFSNLASDWLAKATIENPCWQTWILTIFQWYLFDLRMISLIRQVWLHRLERDSANLKHDDVTKWKHFKCYWPFVRGIHRSPVNSPNKGLMTRNFDAFFDLRLNKRSTQSWCWWFETPSCSLWRHCNELLYNCL